MDTIEITKIGEDTYQVGVSERGHRTTHEVDVSDEYWHKLVGGKINKEELLKKSFEFLLKRERNTEIIAKFSLEKINQYFPDFERDIRNAI